MGTTDPYEDERGDPFDDEEDECKDEVIPSIEGFPFRVMWTQPIAPGGSVALLRDELIASVSESGNLVFREATAGHVLQTAPRAPGFPVAQLDFSPDGTFVLATGTQCEIALWHRADAKQCSVWAPYAPVTSGGGGAFASACWRPRTNTFVVATRASSFTVFEASTLRRVQSFECMGVANLLSIAYSPSGCYLLGGYASGVIRVWDSASGGLISTADTMGCGNAMSFTWTPDGGYLYTAQDAGDVVFIRWKWTEVDASLRTMWIPRKAAPPPGSRATCAAASSDGRHLAVAMVDTRVGTKVGLWRTTDMTRAYAYDSAITAGKPHKLIWLSHDRYLLCVTQTNVSCVSLVVGETA